MTALVCNVVPQICRENSENKGDRDESREGNTFGADIYFTNNTFLIFYRNFFPSNWNTMLRRRTTCSIYSEKKTFQHNKVIRGTITLRRPTPWIFQSVLISRTWTTFAPYYTLTYWYRMPLDFYVFTFSVIKNIIVLKNIYFFKLFLGALCNFLVILFWFRNPLFHMCISIDI